MHRLSSSLSVLLHAFLTALGVLFFATVVAADEQEAKALFEEAEAAFEASDFARAAELFEQANQHAPHPSVLFNAAVSWDHAGEFARAATDYKKSLQDEGLTPDQAEESERRLAALVERVGYVQIATPIGGLVSVAYVQREPIPARFYLDPGSHEVVLETPEAQTTTTSITVEAGQTLKVTLNTLPVPVPVEAEPPKPEPPPPPPLPPPTPQTSTQRTLGWISLGVGVLAAGVAVYLGTEAISAKERYLDDRSNRDLRNDAADKQLQTNVAWGSAGLAGGLGAVLLLTAPTVEF